MANQRDTSMSSFDTAQNGDSQRGAAFPPPSSSPINHLLEHYRQRLMDPQAPTSTSFQLSSQHFDEYKEQISSLFRRYDYDHNRGIITVRMPSETHDGFAWRLSKRLEHTEHGALKQKWKREPDISIRQQNTPFPGCVIEVAYSQSSNDLQRLATDYFIQTDGAIQLFIFVDLKEMARISILRCIGHKIEWVMNAVEFQAANKEPANTKKHLRLNVRDFVRKTEADRYPNHDIEIPFLDLHKMLCEARRNSLIKKSIDVSVLEESDKEWVFPVDFGMPRDPVRNGDGPFNGNQVSSEVTKREGPYDLRPRE
ncbi:hypothetical protein F53441_3969 [Fusarium austroafricanum]|uniref:Uncharacterized protein n=1 Tax=Fusarium austroafricanum TaxID=2364996 RepID=A0A8H4KNY5_9HYPO|nr:hypothetical protein F53441_3969 [Fusarium austroafricanum]